MPSDELDLHLRLADQYWEGGMLTAARAEYGKALAIDPGCFRAALQLAWIDSAFGPVAPARLQALAQGGLAGKRAPLLEALRARAGHSAARLPGSIAEWDIGQMRRSGRAGDSTWWEQCAERAAAAGQHGLARACYDELGEWNPAYRHDPPRQVTSVFLAARQHLDALRSAGC